MRRKKKRGWPALQISVGAVQFAHFLDEHELTLTAAAQALGVSVVTVHDWLRGTKRPVEERRVEIESWTSGRVHRDAWRLPSEARRVVAPYVPPRDSGELPATDNDVDAKVAG